MKVKSIFPTLSWARSLWFCMSVSRLNSGSNEPSFLLNCLKKYTLKHTEVIVVLQFSPFFRALSHYNFSATSLCLLRVISTVHMCTLHGLFAQGLCAQPDHLTNVGDIFVPVSCVTNECCFPRANGNVRNYAAMKEIIEAG